MSVTPWIVGQSKIQPRFRLFCFCYAGGNAISYLPWQDELDSSIEVCAIQLPGRGIRMHEELSTSIAQIVEELLPVIAGRSNVPFEFFGHSLGGIIAFELARYLQVRKMTLPVHLLVSGCGAPRRHAPDQTKNLSDDAFIDLLRDYNGTPLEVLNNRELMDFLLPSIRSDFNLLETYHYHPGGRLPLPISVLAGRSDTDIAEDELTDWQFETSQQCQVHWFEGDHFFIHAAQAEVVAHVDVTILPHLQRQHIRLMQQ